LKNLQITISRLGFGQFRPNLAWRRRLALLSCPAVNGIKSLKFKKYNMAAAAILKNRKIPISRQQFGRLRPDLALRRILTLLSHPTVKNLKF